MKIERDHLIFSTGTTIRGNVSSIGIDMEDEDGSKEITVRDSHGYPIYRKGTWPYGSLTPEECTELADAMIARWQEFKERYK